MLQGTEHLHRTVVWLDGIDRFLTKLQGGAETGQQILQDWLKTEREVLQRNHVIVVATAREASDLPSKLFDSFDRTFSA